MENGFGNKVDGQPGYNTFYPNGIESDEMKNEIEIDVRSLFATILNKLFVIILIGILVGGVAFVYTKFFISPQYVATTKVYILSKQDPISLLHLILQRIMRPFLQPDRFYRR